MGEEWEGGKEWEGGGEEWEGGKEWARNKERGRDEEWEGGKGGREGRYDKLLSLFPQTLPKGISALHNLRVLDLEGNKLEYLATEISMLHCVTLHYLGATSVL